MNCLSMLGKRAGLVIAMLAVLAGLGAGQAAASGAPASAHLFWGGWYDGIGHAKLDGSAPERGFVSGPTNRTFVAANDQYVYWSNLNGNIGRAKLDGSGQQPSLITSAPGYNPGGIAVDDAYVYWLESRVLGFQASIGRAKLDGSEVNRNFITGLDAYSGAGLAVDGQHIYWSTGYEGIGRADIDGQNVQNEYAPRHPGGGSIEGVAVDATHLYWTYDRRQGTGARGDVFRAPLSDTSARELLVSVAYPEGPMQVAVDDAYVYFSLYQSGWIGRADLDGANANLEFVSTNGHPNGGHPVGIALAPAPAPSLSSNADLAGLSLAEGALAPAFSAATTSYELQVGHATTDAHLTATVDDPDATVTVNGNPATSGTAVTVPLSVGPNTLSVVVTAENGTTKTYTVTITRAASNNATLSDLNAPRVRCRPTSTPRPPATSWTSPTT